MASYERNLAQLLEAEEKANKIINQANEKRKKMQQEAEERALDEIKTLRQQMQADFDSKKVDTTKEEREIAEQTKASIRQNEADYNQNKEKVIELLVERILHVKYELPRNVKADFEILKND